MVNLFRPAPAQQGSLTAALLALLEHSDRDLLYSLLKRAGIPFPSQPGAGLTVRFPAPDGPPGTGLLAGPDFQITVSAQQPGEPWDAATLRELPGVPLAITLTGKAPPGVHALSWEQVDRWLAAAAAKYDPQSRTGFLIEQFRAVLPELGIEYFAGFDADLLDRTPQAQITLSRFYQIAALFFERFAAILAAVRAGAAEIRQARPEELLAGYCYRDYSDAALGGSGFLRVAFNLPEARVETACWLTPGDAHSRLRELLGTSAAFRGALTALEEQPLLWLWSPGGEQKLPLETLDPDALDGLDWGQYTVGVQVGLPFEHFPAEDLTGRVAGLVEGLAGTLAPVVTGVVH